ncbi:Beta-glucosidase [Mycena indigotica]|uniref:beta-glucosidase n=1 Tax=Mycena indigotica TaxID=2126181 RepID=A0A8H6W3Q4_9AGAR|nr:Beta-glucosidase [Mycena indigotica]KAF7303827.1 Beta-glucosidase [Mycena indigotica]
MPELSSHFSSLFHMPSIWLFALALAAPGLADVVTGIPDAAPAGFEEWVSPIVIPAPATQGNGDWATAVARARKLVAGLTLEEKVNVTTGIDTQGRCVGNTGTIPRLGWPGICLNDSPLGVRFADLVSGFPTPINAAATWDVDLIGARGRAMGEEHRGKGVNVALGPMTNMGRVAAGGRNWEGFGADPFLSGVATAATISGMQDEGVIATVKHFIGNEQEHFRGGSLAKQLSSSNIDDRTMHEIYAWPFAEAVKAGVGAVMCSYNATQACQNSKLINGILKEELGFQGFIMSDWAAMINGIQPALAGLDMNMPGFTAYGVGNQNEQDPSKADNSFWGAALVEMVNNGSVPQARVDDMVTRIFAAYYRLGQDKNYPSVNFAQLTQQTYLNGQLVNEHIKYLSLFALVRADLELSVQGHHYKVIREIGAASAILLKNTNNALPLSVKNFKRIGIFGSDAGVNPDGPNGCDSHGCDQGTLAMGWGSGTANFPYLSDPLSAITQHVQSINPTVAIDAITNDFNLNQVAKVGSLDDTCLVFVNADSGEGYITVDGNAGDRKNLTLWHSGENLILQTASVCSNTIVVQHIVGPVLVESWFNHPNVTAVINAGLPGQESGRAIVDVLFSDSPQATNPSGRLPYTVAKQQSDYPAQVLYASSDKSPQITYSEGLNLDYRWFDANNIEPRFEFGFGLSYTSFKYSNLKVSLNHAKRATSMYVSVSANVTAGVSSVASSTPSAVSSSVSVSITSSASTSSFSAVPSSASSNATSTSTAPGVISSPVASIGGAATLYDQNTGSLGGNEVSQLYLTFPAGYQEPPKVLRGFARTMVNKGQSKTVTIQLRSKDVSVWDVVQQKWVQGTGQFKLLIGASSRDIRLTGSFTL